MSARSFRSVFMVASCAGAALGCYLVSLRVASERAALEQVETQIVLAQRDIRLLETEIGTRGRLAQLERWNVKVLALSAPSADQFLEGGFALARLVRPQPKLEIEAPVVLAAAPADGAKPRLPESLRDTGQEVAKASRPEELLHVASLRRLVREDGPAKPKTDTPVPAAPMPKRTASGEPPATAGKAEHPKPTAKKKAGDNKAQAAARPVTAPVRTARVDPLAPLPQGANSTTTSRETGPTR